MTDTTKRDEARRRAHEELDAAFREMDIENDKAAEIRISVNQDGYPTHVKWRPIGEERSHRVA